MDETLIKKLTAIVESQKQLEDDISKVDILSLIHISEPTRQATISYESMATTNT